MNFNSSEYDDIRKKILITKGIEQAWCRRFFHHVYSGVRVKVQRKMLSLCDQKSLESMNNSSKNQSFMSYQTKSIYSDNFREKNYLLGMQQKYENMNSIGIQTRIIIQTDQQTSCDLIKSTASVNRKSRSSTSNSETSISEESSTQMSTVSDSTSDTNETSQHHVRYRRNKIRNNSAIDVNIERNNDYTNMNEFTKHKTNKQLSVKI